MDRFRHVNHWNLVPGHSGWCQEDSTGKRGRARRVRSSDIFQCWDKGIDRCPNALGFDRAFPSSPCHVASRRESGVDASLRLLDDAVQMLLSAKALRIDLVDVLSARWTRSEPSALGDHLHPADRSVVTRGAAKDALNPFTGQVC